MTLSSIKKKLLTLQSWKRKRKNSFSQNQLALVLIGVILHLRRLTLLFLLSLIRLGQNKRKISTLFRKTEETIAFLTTLTIEKELEFLVEKVLLQIFFTQMSVTWPQILSEFEMRVPCQT